jgi:hypothetical protein
MKYIVTAYDDMEEARFQTSANTISEANKLAKHLKEINPNYAFVQVTNDAVVLATYKKRIS